MNVVDAYSYEPGAVRVSLRKELLFRKHVIGDQAWYVIEDPISSRFHRVGVAEYRFLSLLDGQTSISEAVARIASVNSDALTEREAAAFCRWLIDSGLASTSASESTGRLLEASESIESRRRKEWLNPVMLKLRLGNPEPLVQLVAPLTTWLLTAPGFVVWCFVCAIGGYSVVADWDQLDRPSGVLSSDNWLWLGLTWFILKICHEAAHAVACDRHGGVCRHCGVLLLLFVPLPYVDATSSWRFASRWKRMQVAAAGMYAELLVAGLAAIIWSQTSSELIQHHSLNVMITACVMTLLFNLNPLMRFDGYFILTDAFQLPNLATHGQQEVRSLARRLFFGGEASSANWSFRRRLFIRVYGMLAMIWRIIIGVSLTYAAARIYHGAGIVLAAVAAMMWLGLPLLRLLKSLVIGDSIVPPNRIRFVAVFSVLAGFGYAVWNHVPYVEQLRLPAVVDYDPIETVRAGASGFVTDICIRSGQTVRAGDVLVRLSNPDLRLQIQQRQLAIRQSQLDAIRYHRRENLSAWQIEKENLAALQAQLLELQDQSRQLLVVSDSDGTVVSPGLQDLQGQWLTAGDVVCEIGNDATRKLHVLIPQSSIDVVTNRRDSDVSVHLWGRQDQFRGVIVNVESQGTTDIRHPALTATAGGPIPVKAVEQPTRDTAGWTLLEPHFSGHVNLNDNGSLLGTGTGQTGFVKLTLARRSVGEKVSDRLRTMHEQWLAAPW